MDGHKKSRLSDEQAKAKDRNLKSTHDRSDPHPAPSQHGINQVRGSQDSREPEGIGSRKEPHKDDGISRRSNKRGSHDISNDATGAKQSFRGSHRHSKDASFQQNHDPEHHLRGSVGEAIEESSVSKHSKRAKEKGGTSKKIKKSPEELSRRRKLEELKNRLGHKKWDKMRKRVAQQKWEKMKKLLGTKKWQQLRQRYRRNKWHHLRKRIIRKELKRVKRRMKRNKIRRLKRLFGNKKYKQLRKRMGKRIWRRMEDIVRQNDAIKFNRMIGRDEWQSLVGKEKWQTLENDLRHKRVHTLEKLIGPKTWLGLKKRIDGNQYRQVRKLFKRNEWDRLRTLIGPQNWHWFKNRILQNKLKHQQNLIGRLNWYRLRSGMTQEKWQKVKTLIRQKKWRKVKRVVGDKMMRRIQRRMIEKQWNISRNQLLRQKWLHLSHQVQRKKKQKIISRLGNDKWIKLKSQMLLKEWRELRKLLGSEKWEKLSKRLELEKLRVIRKILGTEMWHNVKQLLGPARWRVFKIWMSREKWTKLRMIIGKKMWHMPKTKRLLKHLQRSRRQTLHNKLKKERTRVMRIKLQQLRKRLGRKKWTEIRKHTLRKNLRMMRVRLLKKRWQKIRSMVQREGKENLKHRMGPKKWHKFQQLMDAKKLVKPKGKDDKRNVHKNKTIHHDRSGLGLRGKKMKRHNYSEFYFNETLAFKGRHKNENIRRRQKRLRKDLLIKEKQENRRQAKFDRKGKCFVSRLCSWLKSVHHGPETYEWKPAAIQAKLYIFNMIQGLAVLITTLNYQMSSSYAIPHAFAIFGMYILVYFASALDFFGSLFGLMTTSSLGEYYNKIEKVGRPRPKLKKKRTTKKKKCCSCCCPAKGCIGRPCRRCQRCVCKKANASTMNEKSLQPPADAKTDAKRKMTSSTRRTLKRGTNTNLGPNSGGQITKPMENAANKSQNKNGTTTKKGCPGLSCCAKKQNILGDAPAPQFEKNKQEARGKSLSNKQGQRKLETGGVKRKETEKGSKKDKTKALHKGEVPDPKTEEHNKHSGEHSGKGHTERAPKHSHHPERQKCFGCYDDCSCFQFCKRKHHHHHHHDYHQQQHRESCCPRLGSPQFVNRMGYSCWLCLQLAWLLNVFFTAYYNWVDILSGSYREAFEQCSLDPRPPHCDHFEEIHFYLLCTVGVSFLTRSVLSFFIGMCFKESLLRRRHSNDPYYEQASSCSDTDVDYEQVPKQLLIPFQTDKPWIPTWPDLSKFKKIDPQRVLNAKERQVEGMLAAFKDVRRDKLVVRKRRAGVKIRRVKGALDTIQMPEEIMTAKARAWLSAEETDSSIIEQKDLQKERDPHFHGHLRRRPGARRRIRLGREGSTDSNSLTIVHDPESYTRRSIFEIINPKMKNLSTRISTDDSWSGDSHTLFETASQSNVEPDPVELQRRQSDENYFGILRQMEEEEDEAPTARKKSKKSIFSRFFGA